MSAGAHYEVATGKPLGPLTLWRGQDGYWTAAYETGFAGMAEL
jgi:hypothetical protein